MKYQKWHIGTASEQDTALLKEAGYPSLLATVLAARGITTSEAAAEALERETSLTISPMLMRDMDKAVARIQKALANDETIAVFGDYDVDGITSTVLLLDYLKNCGAKCLRYIPRRIEDGYGLSKDAIQGLRDKGATLMITVDCGITGNEEIDFAASIGMDVVVTDHHECKENLPRAVAVVDPHRPDDAYPFKYLAGVGVALKLVLALGGPDRENALFARYCTLAAIGTIADVMRMEGENRTIVSCGLAALNHTDFVGIHALLKEAGLLGKPITSIQIGFVLSPRINAAGRIANMEIGIQCLLAGEANATELASQLEDINDQRKALERSMQEEALDSLSDADIEHRMSLVLSHPDWHQGLVGLVASRVKERTHRPVIAFAPTKNGLLRGSGRSIPGLHLRYCLSRIDTMFPGLILRYGGHALAAGLTIRGDGLEQFRDAFEKVVSENISPELLTEDIVVDGALAPEEISFGLIREIDSVVWGQSFEAPLFANEFDIVRQTPLRGGEHLKATVSTAGQHFDAIFFRHSTPLPGRVKLAYRLDVNEWMGRKSLQLMIENAEE